jgi:hypothetical protein
MFDHMEILKLSNILVCNSEDPNNLVVAKLPHLRFSMPTHLVGRTPLWSVPDATEELFPQVLHLTDV